MGEIYVRTPHGTLVIQEGLPIRRQPDTCPKCERDLTGVCMIPWRGCEHCVKGLRKMMHEPPPEGWPVYDPSSEQGGEEP